MLKKGIGCCLLVLAMLLSNIRLQAQAGTDTLLKLMPDEYLALVRNFHPVMKQAGYLVSGAEAFLLANRGMFDPSVYFSTDQKTFGGTSYFNYTNTELKIPTWFGVELMAGIESNNGLRMNRSITEGQSSYAGFKVPLAKNLLMDKRRAALQQARLLVSQSKAERLLAVNDLMFDAIGAYWNWVREYQVYKVLTDAVRINQVRFEGIRILVEQGDRAGVDSTEALTQLLTFQAQQNEALMRFITAGYELSNFLWTEDEKPVLIPGYLVPGVNTDSINPYSIAYQPLNDLLQLASATHPKLQSFDFKLDALEVERRLKFQSLLPTVDLKYNALSKGYEWWKGAGAVTFDNNFKFGLDVGIPLFLRQGRGDYKAAKIKIQSTTLDRDMTRLNIENKVRQYFNEQINLLQQLRLQERALDAYRKVLEVELMKFELGESTLFLLNSRENKVLESQQKVAETRAKVFKSLYGVQWAAGILR